MWLCADFVGRHTLAIFGAQPRADGQYVQGFVQPATPLDCCSPLNATALTGTIVRHAPLGLCACFWLSLVAAHFKIFLDPLFMFLQGILHTWGLSICPKSIQSTGLSCLCVCLCVGLGVSCVVCEACWVLFRTRTVALFLVCCAVGRGNCGHSFNRHFAKFGHDRTHVDHASLARGVDSCCLHNKRHGCVNTTNKYSFFRVLLPVSCCTSLPLSENSFCCVFLCFFG